MAAANRRHFPSSDVRMVFVCGCGHSGTTLVAAMLGAHPTVYAIPRETGAFINSDVRFARLLFEHDFLPDAIRKGASVICEKTPHHVRRLPVMRRAFPDARIIVIVRDPRDVAASIKRRLGNLEAGIRRWNADNIIVRNEIESGRSDLLVISYEQLIADPEETLKTVSAHIALDYQPSMLEFHKDPRIWFFGNDDRHLRFRNWQIHQPLTDRRGLWKTTLSVGEARQVEGECSALMRFFGYLPPKHVSPLLDLAGRSLREIKERLRPARRRLRRALGLSRRHPNHRRSVKPNDGKNGDGVEIDPKDTQ